MALRLLPGMGLSRAGVAAAHCRGDRPVNGRVDFAYPQIRLIIELDGRAWHSTLEAFESDRMRDNHAQLAGWRVLRITYRMLKEQSADGPRHDSSGTRHVAA